MGAAMIGVLWSYGGWQHASFAAGEAKRAGRDVPLGMIIGTAIITLVYVLATVAYLRLLPLDVLIASPHVASDAVQAAIGPVGGSIVAAAIAASALGTAGIFTLTAPRVYWAMADRGLFFKGVADLHPTWRTPVRAIVLQTAWAIVLVLAWGTFESLVSYVLFVDWLFFGLCEIHERELGNFLLSELQSIQLPFGLRIERDMHFDGHVVDKTSNTVRSAS